MVSVVSSADIRPVAVATTASAAPTLQSRRTCPISPPPRASDPQAALPDVPVLGGDPWQRIAFQHTHRTTSRCRRSGIVPGGRLETAEVVDEKVEPLVIAIRAAARMVGIRNHEQV